MTSRFRVLSVHQLCPLCTPTLSSLYTNAPLRNGCEFPDRVFTAVLELILRIEWCASRPISRGLVFFAPPRPLFAGSKSRVSRHPCHPRRVRKPTHIIHHSNRRHVGYSICGTHGSNCADAAFFLKTRSTSVSRVFSLARRRSPHQTRTNDTVRDSPEHGLPPRHVFTRRESGTEKVISGHPQSRTAGQLGEQADGGSDRGQCARPPSAAGASDRVRERGRGVWAGVRWPGARLGYGQPQPAAHSQKHSRAARGQGGGRNRAERRERAGDDGMWFGGLRRVRHGAMCVGERCV